MKKKGITNVTLRRRELKSGRVALYLNVNLHGDRHVESLNLYLEPERTSTDRARNRRTLELAEQMRAKRLIEVHETRCGLREANPAEEILLVDFYDECGHERNGTRRAVWATAGIYLRQFFRDATLAEVDGPMLERYKAHLCTVERQGGGKLSANSLNVYFACVRTCLREAKRLGYDVADVSTVGGFKREDTERAYLTPDELRRLTATKCKCEWVRNPFLFSCLTGMRRSDVARLTWGQVSTDGSRIVFRQKKTGGVEYADLSPQALALMGERGKAEDPVFPDFKILPNIGDHLKRWAKAAGIDKPITFHSGRHTFATMMLEAGADLYTVSRMLGHRNTTVTQIYARITDRRRREALALMPDILGQEAPQSHDSGALNQSLTNIPAKTAKQSEKERIKF